MKKLILLLVLIQQMAYCQTENSVFPNVPYTELSALAVEGDYIYTAGNCNTALVSKNAGQSWTTVSVDDFVKSIKVVPGSNGQKAFFLYSDGIFLFDINTLEFDEISTSSLFLSSGNFKTIEVDNENVYVLSNQNVHKAPIGAYNWTKVIDFGFQNDAVEVSDITQNYIYIGSLRGLLLRYQLGTGTLETMNDFMFRVYSFDMVTDDLGYFTIQNFTYPIKTMDGGLTYTNLDKLPENIGVIGYGENVIMTINTNRIYVSTDGGQSSKYIPIPDDGTYDLVFSSFMSEDGVLYMAGRSSMIMKTENFGASFINLNEYKRENLYGIDMHSNGTGVAVGGLNSIIKTNDGGVNWALQDLNIDVANNYLNSVSVISQNKYLVAGSNTLTIVENDQITNKIPISLEAMQYNAQGGYLIGLRTDFSDFSIVKSTDDGLTWESKAFLPNHQYHISQSPTGKIYIPGDQGIIYTSIDGGETWEIESFGGETDIRRLTFLDENYGIASNGLKLFLTTDGGATSSTISTGYDVRNLHFVSKDQIVYTTSNEAQTNFYESINGGASFQAKKIFCSMTTSSFIDTNNVIWLAQNGGHINKYKVEGSTSTKNLENNLLSIFPNPIVAGQEFNIDSEENISEVILTSFSGKTLRKISPSKSNTFSTVGLSSGIYTLAMKNDQGELKYGKLVIVE